MPVKKKIIIVGTKESGADLVTARIERLKLSPTDRVHLKNLELGRYDWILFTSKNSVEFFVKELHVRTLPPSVRIAAVGPETAHALKRAGIRVDLIPKEFSAKHIVQALDRAGRSTGDLKGKRILFPRSAIAPMEPVRALRERGARVSVMHLYTTIPARIPRKLMRPIKKGDADHLVFMSPSGIAGLMKNVRGNDAKKAVRNIPVVCIGPLTATAARRFKFKKIHAAKTHTAEGISDLLRTLA